MGAWSFLLVHIQFTPSEGSKGLVNCFFRKSDHGSQTMEKGHLTWSDFIVHCVNWPLVEEGGHEKTRAHFTIIWKGLPYHTEMSAKRYWGHYGIKSPAGCLEGITKSIWSTLYLCSVRLFVLARVFLKTRACSLGFGHGLGFMTSTNITSFITEIKTKPGPQIINFEGQFIPPSPY